MIVDCRFKLGKLLRVYLSFLGIDFEDMWKRISTEDCTVFQIPVAAVFTLSWATTYNAKSSDHHHEAHSC